MQGMDYARLDVQLKDAFSLYCQMVVVSHYTILDF